MPRHILLAITCLVGLGCRRATTPMEGEGRILVRTEHAVYRPVELVVIITHNGSGATVYDDHCGGEVQGYELLGRWNASYGASRACVNFDAAPRRSRSVAIPPGAVHVDTMHVNGRAYTGTWRVALLLRDEAGGPLAEEQRTSDTFHVDGTWTP